ncbi:MAG: hypothetical protein CL484_06070 [Acidobacteria bacterium]|nr:hypothetical protein [Acidobacteriota bacterium]|tara:strand:+ start:12300 stop:13355 length:1056 start_codon:yes stop_codon:yes gene_type:complete
MSILEGYHAARRTAGVIDFSSRGRIVVAGEDRVSYLQGLLTNDIASLKSGYGCYAAYLTPQGRMLADLSVINLGEALFLDVSSSCTTMLVDRLREFVFMENVTVEDRTRTWTAFGLYGPEAARIVSEVIRLVEGFGITELGAGELSNLKEYRHFSGEFSGTPVVVVRSDEIGEVGFLVYVESPRSPFLADALRQAGAKALDVETFDLLRLESGRPVFPADMNQETIPLEAGIQDRAISLEKGCYVGQEVVIRILHRGQGRVARRLVGLSFKQSDVTPPPGTVLTTPDDPSDKVVGTLTSTASSPALERPIALGYVVRELAEVGTKLVVLGVDQRIPVVVTSGSFLELPRSG